MPKRLKALPLCPAPIQLPLFPDAASLIRIRPEHNEWRFYRMEVWPDLFGHALLLCQWGRIGTEGRRRLDPDPDPVPPSTRLPALPGASVAVDIGIATYDQAIPQGRQACQAGTAATGRHGTAHRGWCPQISHGR